MAGKRFVPGRKMSKPTTTFEKKKQIIEERIADVKESMVALRITMQETTDVSNVKLPTSFYAIVFFFFIVLTMFRK